MSKLANRLAHDFPQFHFVASNRAHWSYDEQAIYYTDDDLQTLHELGHALLQHHSYNQDIELIKLERAAWDVARKLAPRYEQIISDQVIEEALDSYRDWLHARSKCPQCGQTGTQDSTSLNYYCPTCGYHWRASDGKYRRLKRTQVSS